MASLVSVNRLNVVCLFFGAAFGFLFSAAGFNQYDVIHRMLLFQDAAPYLVMASSIATAIPLLWLMEHRHWNTVLGGPLSLTRWSFERKHVLGGLVFGTGWAITGACPGTVSAMVGAGGLLGLVTLCGVLCGIALRDAVKERVATGAHVTEAAPGALITDSTSG